MAVANEAEKETGVRESVGTASDSIYCSVLNEELEEFLDREIGGKKPEDIDTEYGEIRIIYGEEESLLHHFTDTLEEPLEDQEGVEDFYDLFGGREQYKGLEKNLND